MAFFPNTADPVPIILHHTASDTATPSLLYAGETAVCHGPTHTKMWIGDGTANRMLLSTNPADSPLLNQSVLGGPFLPLSGGTLTGPGNLTLDGGTLTVSGAYPGVTLDVTGTTPRQWRMEAEDYWWGLTTGDGVWPFYMARNPGPPVSYRLDVRGNLYIREALTVEQDADIWGFLDAQQNLLVRNWVEPTNGGIVHLRRTTPVDVAGAHLGSAIGLGFPVFTWDPPGVEPQTVSARPGAEIRFNSTKAWLRNDVYDPNPPHDLLSSTEELGAEINFFVTRNGEGLPYRAMTLQQDGNLSVVGTVTASGTLLTSDPDLKDDIAQAPPGALAKVRELPVIDYRWKHGRDGKLHRGFLATDVARVMGEDSGCSAKGAYSLADMNAVLWAAVQELAAEVRELRNRVH